MIDWTQLLGAMRMPGQTAQQGVRQFGNVFNPQAGLGGGQAQPNEQPEKTPWLNQDSYGGLSKGEMLLAGAGMLSGKDLQQGIGNAAQFAYGSMERNRKKQEEEARKKQMQMALAGIEMTPEQRAIAAAAPDLALGQVAQSAFAPPSTPEQFTLSENQVRYDSAGNVIAQGMEKQTDQWVDVPAPAGQQGYFQKNERTGAVKRVATPPSGGITIGSDGSVQIGGPARDLGYGSAPKGKEAAIVQGQDGQPLTSPGPQQKVYNQSVQQLADYEAGTDIVTEDINRAIEQAGTWTTGFLGAKLKGVEGTPAHNLQQTLQSIKANVGFDKLQNMRDNSPTGGALGQVTELELGLLQSVWGALEQSQTQEQFVYNLERLGQIKKEFRERKRQALQIDYPELSQTMDFRQQTNEQIQGWSDADEQRLRELEALAGGQ
mgnify:CR=1 FL=1